MFNQKGFTLVELVSVMVIMSVLASVTIKKFDLVSDNAETRALEAAVAELNARESLIWTNVKLSPAGWSTDENLFELIDTTLGQGFTWDGAPTASGGILEYRNQSKSLTRNASTSILAARWN
jgi:prepilin-type N-terminal cleavage/methylation domain-containing protein